MYLKKFTSFCQVLNKDAHKRKLVPFFLPHSVYTYEYGLFDVTMSCAKMAEPIKIPFGASTQVDLRNHVLDGACIPPEEGAVLWHFSPLYSTRNIWCAVDILKFVW